MKNQHFWLPFSLFQSRLEKKMYETTIFFLDRLQMLILQVKCTLNKYKVFKKLCATITLVFSLFVSSRRKRRRRASRHKKALKCQQDKSKVRPFMVCPNTLLIWANFSSSRCGGSICCCKVKKMWCYLGLLKMPREKERPPIFMNWNMSD